MMPAPGETHLGNANCCEPWVGGTCGFELDMAQYRDGRQIDIQSVYLEERAEIYLR